VLFTENIVSRPSVTRPIVGAPALVGYLVFLSVSLALAACDPVDPPEPTSCSTFEGADFELGTGERNFVPLQEGQELTMISGPQGGCHFWLSIRTDGFAARRLDIQYDVVFADSSTTTGSRSSRKVRLNLIEDGSGRCEHIAYPAVLIQPWYFRDREVRIEVTLLDDLGRSARTSVRVLARWPEDQDGRPSEDLCGAR
jgi:hypothetical protein